MVLYRYFNIAESYAWFCVAIAIHFVAKPDRDSQRKWLLLASCVFVLFGVTDRIESELDGAMPIALWISKLGCGALLLGCRIFYVGLAKFSWKERYFLLLLGCLAASIVTAVVHAVVL